MKRWWYVWLVSSLLVAGAAVVLVWPYLTGSHSSPRGLQWDKPEGIRAELAKEREWADQEHVPLPVEGFLAARGFHTLSCLAFFSNVLCLGRMVQVALEHP